MPEKERANHIPYELVRLQLVAINIRIKFYSITSLNQAE